MSISGAKSKAKQAGNIQEKIDSGAGFKMLVDQNKIIIRQNELILRALKGKNGL